jgi:BirA family biotin operon repressor/biotin-[acetyl-CoA-carboxylase] ligase
MVFNQQQFEVALSEVGKHLSQQGIGMGNWENRSRDLKPGYLLKKNPSQPPAPSPQPPVVIPPRPVEEIPLHLFDTLPSTNQTLWELLNQGATAGSIVIAAQQTAGRGQWGRQWQSNVGGLYLSLALATNLPASNSAQLTLSGAWGIATALRHYGIPVFLKWPNDLLLKGRKLGGILTETRVRQGWIAQAVVGVGINWSNCVPESGINLQAFCEEELNLGVTSLEMLAAIVIQGLNFGYQSLSEQGMENLLPSYLELLDSQGRHITVDGNLGTIVGVTPTGDLRVSLNSTEAAVGEVTTSASLTEICLKPGTISLGYCQ